MHDTNEKKLVKSYTIKSTHGIGSLPSLCLGECRWLVLRQRHKHRSMSVRKRRMLVLARGKQSPDARSQIKRLAR